MTPAVEPSGWVALPADPLYDVPVADTRSPLSAVTLRSTPAGMAIDAAIATDFPLVGWSDDRWAVSFGLEAGAFMQFGAGGELTFDLYTFDGLFGAPLSVAVGPWSARLGWAHLSAHYSDGVRKADEKPTNLDAWSREQVTLHGARMLGPARLYAGIRVLHHALPVADPFAFQVGAEIIGPWALAPYGAADLQVAQESGWSPAIAGQIGLAWRGPRSRLRVAATGRAGPDDTGKLTGQADPYLGLTVGFDRGAFP